MISLSIFVSYLSLSSIVGEEEEEKGGNVQHKQKFVVVWVEFLPVTSLELADDACK